MLKKNWDITKHWFNAALLARIVLFEQFLSIADRHGISLGIEMRKRWVLAQILPQHVFQTDEIDPLNSLTQHIGKCATTDDIEAALDVYWRNIAELLHKLEPSLKSDDRNPRLFVVIDEAQDGITQLPEAFMSGSQATEKFRTKRPVLRQLVFTLTSAFDRVRGFLNTTYVVTGTGISKEMLEEAISSVYFKQRRTIFVTIYNTGGFDSEIDQQNYIASYLGGDFPESEIGKYLCPRMWHWLQGRYRFTAEYLALLIEDGLRRPHLLLNEYVSSFGGFHPTDSGTLLEENVEHDGSRLPSFTFSFLPLNFDKLKEAREASVKLNTIAKAAYPYFMRSMTGNDIDLGKDERIFIECGVARWQYSTKKRKFDCKIKEPLVLLTAMVRLSLEDGIPLYQHLVDDIDKNVSFRNRNGFEAYLAYFFARAFGNEARLGAVFDLQYSVGEALANHNATLVSLYRGGDDYPLEEEAVLLFSDQNGERNSNTVGFVRDSGSVDIPGCLAEHANDTASVERWLRHRTHTAFCYPTIKMGPDLIFVLKLTSPNDEVRYLWVAVQVKWYRAEQSPNLKKDELEDAIRSVTPGYYFLEQGDVEEDQLKDHDTLPKEKGNRERLEYRNNVLKAMDDLADREPLAGPHSVLRVVASFPQGSNFQLVPEARYFDTHPLASLNRNYLMTRLENITPRRFLAEIYERDRNMRLKNPDSIIPPINKKQIQRLSRVVAWGKDMSKLDVKAATMTELQDQIDRIRAFRSWEWIPCKSWRIDTKGKLVLSEFVYDLLQDRYTFTDDEEKNEVVIKRRGEIIPVLLKKNDKYEKYAHALIDLASEAGEDLTEYESMKEGRLSTGEPRGDVKTEDMTPGAAGVAQNDKEIKDTGIPEGKTYEASKVTHLGKRRTRPG
ncbi:hypothetical protein K435DRAFT_842364 [Dendrothele bispora CBS 962.96]|uniref:Uncharacterized protein n=1 Tax=Dendrothele bispora (strain CBS 962.96) TaxID=1314807 RepID=A0A4S8LH38_DENBC|nr:hypothetical protein K435DRAFT_842364 [Dendrothele bispora CBS 962.96]